MLCDQFQHTVQFWWLAIGAQEITSQVPRIDTINGGIKALVV